MYLARPPSWHLHLQNLQSRSYYCGIPFQLHISVHS
ncbi:Protein of unknown function [Pyronema omphalodes CBS 100304]|uniref:Uncharacterized protein n=1 Tax=Pyronema omphalodes (strain CBS 100304) TaxID=1076935 RepID=U4L987_PYROM|nr:Protein of unknown function [Pyronema omphalodes CBS 100304]